MEGKPKRMPTIRYREAGGAYYLAQRYRCFEVGPVGWRIWHLCDGATPVADIVASVVGEYDGVSEQQAGSDCERFLQSLTDAGLLAWE